MKSFYIKLFPIAIIVCLGTIVYSNTFFYPFQFDDIPYIVSNPAIRHIQDLQSIWHFWPCRFIFCLSTALNYHFHQLNVFGYHLFSLAVHLLAAILVWWLTLLTFSTPAMKEEKIAQHAKTIAVLVGLIFVAHPIQTQAVTYISQRATSLVALFYLASLCFYIKSRSEKIANVTVSKCYYICSLIMAIVAMFTKENAITLPLMILLYEFTFLNKKKSFDWKGFIPFGLTILIIPLTIFLTKQVNSPDVQDVLAGSGGISTMHYLLTEFRVMFTYIRLLFFPFNQNLDYDYPIFKSIFDWPVLTSCLLLIAILVLAKRLFSKYRLVSFSILWFFLTLLPESSIFPIRDLINEHRLYLPMVGFSLFLVSSMYYLWRKNTLKGMVIFLLLITACYSILAYQRNKIWKDELTLWNDVVSRSPHKARDYNNRGLAYYNLGKFDEAMSDFNQAIAIDPDYVKTYCNRGRDYDRQGMFVEAMADYNKAIAMNFNVADVYTDRGILYGQQGEFTQAIADLSQAIEIDPDREKDYYNLGLIYAKQGNWAQAIADFNKAIEIDPGYLAAYNIRAFIFYKLRRYDEAWGDVHKARSLGFDVDPQLISALQTASGRDQ